jgi:hypothetical protein
MPSCFAMPPLPRRQLTANRSCWEDENRSASDALAVAQPIQRPHGLLALAYPSRRSTASAIARTRSRCSPARENAIRNSGGQERACIGGIGYVKKGTNRYSWPEYTVFGAFRQLVMDGGDGMVCTQSDTHKSVTTEPLNKSCLARCRFYVDAHQDNWTCDSSLWLSEVSEVLPVLDSRENFGSSRLPALVRAIFSDKIVMNRPITCHAKNCRS